MSDVMASILVLMITALVVFRRELAGPWNAEKAWGRALRRSSSRNRAWFAFPRGWL
jgi:hypothetical protein